jgi:hypothetical protein
MIEAYKAAQRKVKSQQPKLIATVIQALAFLCLGIANQSVMNESLEPFEPSTRQRETQ